jgi:CubicO group peptidase (beta-lactamase class C family)
MKNHVLSLLFVVLFASCNCQQETRSTLTETAPEMAGFSSERLALADSLINEYVQKDWLPGGVFLLARHGKIVYYKNVGYRTNAKDQPYQKDDIFRIASMTKAVTCVSIMQLYERGQLQLDDPVYQYIPAFKNSAVLDQFNDKDSTYTTVPVKRPITIRMLMTHTAGIMYGYHAPHPFDILYAKYKLTNAGFGSETETTEDFVNRIAEVPLEFQPGEHFHYGLNIDVLGRIVEVVSGKTLSDYFSENIFEPLGMNDTRFYLPQDKQDRLVPLYAQGSDGSLTMTTEGGMAGTTEYPKFNDVGYYAGGAGLTSTAMDYARFIEALVNDGEYDGHRILGRKTIGVMTADQMVDLNRKGNGYSNIPGNTYCLGFNLRTVEGAGINSKSPGTFEWGGYYSTKFFIDPKEDLIFVGMTQVMPFRHGEFYDKLTAVLYGAIEN